MVQFKLNESKKGEIMSGWEILAVVAIVYWLANK